MSCGPRADDINQVQPGYVKKAIFQQDSEWYYRRTVAKSETTNQYVIEGHGDIGLDRVKWRVEEKLLIAYKPYEAIPGTQNAEYEGKTDFEGTVLAEFPIVSHFDIKRNYDPTTGQESNIIGENTSDRPWYERDYMRVDFATNLIDRSWDADNSGYWIPVSWLSSSTYWTDQDTRPTDEFASRFTNDYIEITHNALLGMDIYMCAAFTGYSWTAFGQCGFGEAKVRHSFKRIKEKSDYIPRDYPDSYVRKDGDGKTIYDPITGEVVREPIYNRFGIFRTETPTYDRGYGTTESGRLFRALIFNIWERHTDDQGNELPMSQRKPKPIIYYLNADYPERWRRVAAEVAAEYDRVYRGMVVDIVGEANTPEHMFEIRDNDCSAANVKSFVTLNPQYTPAIERAVCKDGDSCDNPLDKIAFGNLTTVCTSLEAATRDPETGVPAFDWQRIGDARYNMLVWLNNPQFSPWAGYGPMHSDARTGESVGATAFIRGFYYETTAAEVVDYIELMNDEKSVEDIIYGQDIRKMSVENVRRYRQLVNAKPSPTFTSMLTQRLESRGTSRAELLREVEPSHQVNRLMRAQGTEVEAAVTSNFDLMMASGGTWNPKMGEPSADLVRAASPLGRLEHNPLSPQAAKIRATLQRVGYCFMNYDQDVHWAGLAEVLKDVPREQRLELIASRMIKHVMLHELGHNVGMAHNFEGTYDALNYYDQFWDVHWGSDEEKIAAQYDEHRNTSVMEYIGQGKGMFSDRLGKYDEAAIRFAYGNQVAVFDSGNVDPNLQGGETLRAWRYMNDYTKIPDHLCGDGGCADDDARRDAIRARRWVNFDPQNPPANEVPFLFCDNTYNHMTPFCATFDYGSNLKEIFANYKTAWSSYFFFNNFVRDRLSPLGWSPAYAIYPLQNALLFVDTVGQYLYYMAATQPGFLQTDLGQDMQITVAEGLNLAAEVVATPEPLRMCPWPGTSNPQIFIPYYFLNGCDPYADLASQYAIDAEAIQLPLGDARPSTLGFTEDYEEWDWAFVGSYFDKSNVLWLLGYNRPRFFRFNYDLDQRNYDISLFRLFEPELRSFYDRLVNLDGYFIESDTAVDLGSYWCRDPEAPNVAHLGRFEPRRLMDPTSMTNPSLPGPSADCESPAVVYPELLRNMPFDTMFWAHALFSSDWDSQLDMSKSMKIYALGADDDFISWNELPADQICSCVDDMTGLEYRSIHMPEGVPDIGCRLIDKACTAQDDWLGSQGNPSYKDRSRAWFERLEFARDLTRLFDRAAIWR
ncbi:zinc-dependent metalloprotease [Myxococcota bacterium]|nr:zinc-dependent metalloprotease [Myxococcota bacterium]